MGQVGSELFYYEGQSENSDNGLITFLSIILWSWNFTHWGFYTLRIKSHQKHACAPYNVMSFARFWNVMAAVSVEEQWSYIKTEYLRGKSGKEIHENLCEACGNNALSFKTVYRWLARFSAGKTDILDEARSGSITRLQIPITCTKWRKSLMKTEGWHVIK